GFCLRGMPTCLNGRGAYVRLIRVGPAFICPTLCPTPVEVVQQVTDLETRPDPGSAGDEGDPEDHGRGDEVEECLGSCARLRPDLRVAVGHDGEDSLDHAMPPICPTASPRRWGVSLYSKTYQRCGS